MDSPSVLCYHAVWVLGPCIRETVESLCIPPWKSAQCRLSERLDPDKKRNSTPRRLLVRSGPGNNSLLRDTPLDSAAASKTTCILFFFLGWYKPKWGRYQQSFSGLRFSCGTISAWLRSKIFCVTVKYCSFITGFLSRVRRVDLGRFIAFTRLLGRSLTSCRKSSGASQL